MNTIEERIDNHLDKKQIYAEKARKYGCLADKYQAKSNWHEEKIEKLKAKQAKQEKKAN